MIIENAYYLFFGSTMVSMTLLLYHWWGMLRNIREEKRTLATFLAPFVPFMPEMFTEIGNRNYSGKCDPALGGARVPCHGNSCSIPLSGSLKISSFSSGFLSIIPAFKINGFQIQITRSWGGVV
jgi:hypothetical protein